MAITKRTDITDTLLYYLGTIRENGGASCDINTVVRQRDTVVDPFAPEECWAINVLDGEVEVEHGLSYDQHSMPVTIELHATSRVTAAEAEDAMADVMNIIRLYNDWGGHADGTTQAGNKVERIQTGDTIIAAVIFITIHYTTETCYI